MANDTQTGLRLIPPPADLRAFVQSYWLYTAENTAASRLHPDMSTALVFNLADSVCLDGAHLDKGLSFVGPYNHTIRMSGMTAQTALFGVRLRPLAARLLSGEDQSTFRNRWIEASALSSLHAVDHAFELPNDANGLVKLADHTTKGLRNILAKRLSSETTASLQHAGSLYQALKAAGSLEQFTARSGYSERHSNRIFNNTLGFPAKQLLLQDKINTAREALKHTDAIPISEIALQSGFYDQAHFSRQFKKITGETPGQYRQRYKKT